jgi:small subunit ribosomal protein S16
MATRIRLARRGRKKAARFEIVIADSRAPRDGKFIEKIGTYNPQTVPATIVIDDEKAMHWLMVGAQPSETVRRMLHYKGLMFRKHLQLGVNKGAITQESADQKMADWRGAKDQKIETRISKLSGDKQQAAKDRMVAEAKVKEARTNAIRKKQEDAAKANEPAAPATEETTENAGE